MRFVLYKPCCLYKWWQSNRSLSGKRGMVNDKNDDAKGKKIFIYTFFFLIKNQFYCVNYKPKLFRDCISCRSYSICKSKYYIFVEQFDSSQFLLMPLICWPLVKNVILTANTVSLNKNLIELKHLSTISVFNIKTKR